MTSTGTLAIHGGPKVRDTDWPPRNIFGESELEMVRKAFEHAWDTGRDFAFQDEYEEHFTNKFCEFQGGGYADAVCTGTAAIWIALAALEIPTGSDVVVSPVTNPGSVTPAILQGMNIVVADSAPAGFNVEPEEFERVLTPNTRAAILTHLGGVPVDIEPIVESARAKGIKIIEDCSHAPGATIRRKKVGRFGEIAALSTMFSKTLATGGCGGLVYTQDEELYWKARTHADRGQDFRRPDFNNKNPGQCLFPAMNYNLDELSCAIGFSIMSRLQDIIDKRLELVAAMNAALAESDLITPIDVLPGCKPSPFFHTVILNLHNLCATKEEFTAALAAEGVRINPHYREVVCEWPWIRPYLKGKKETPNAVNFRDRTFNILFHEGFGIEDVQDIAKCILKVAAFYCK